ncbi:MAG: hypothetical protein P4M14_01670 [Gammaproteobacteria bacterium]|nr:hypothetical protein [Gammaproteobacteria bacterium]
MNSINTNIINVDSQFCPQKGTIQAFFTGEDNNTWALIKMKRPSKSVHVPARVQDASLQPARLSADKIAWLVGNEVNVVPLSATQNIKGVTLPDEAFAYTKPAEVKAPVKYSEAEQAKINMILGGMVKSFQQAFEYLEVFDNEKSKKFREQVSLIISGREPVRDQLNKIFKLINKAHKKSTKKSCLSFRSFFCGTQAEVEELSPTQEFFAYVSKMTVLSRHSAAKLAEYVENISTGEKGNLYAIDEERSLSSR